MKLNQLSAIAKIALLPIAAVTFFGQAASADTLVTQDFQVSIAQHCAEGNVTCNNVSYRGTNIHTGAALQLKGRTLHSLCADGVTPCQFLGYQFRNGAYTYTVTANGHLIVKEGAKLLLDQVGTWEEDDL